MPMVFSFKGRVFIPLQAKKGCQKSCCDAGNCCVTIRRALKCTNSYALWLMSSYSSSSYSLHCTTKKMNVSCPLSPFDFIDLPT